VLYTKKYWRRRKEHLYKTETVNSSCQPWMEFFIALIFVLENYCLVEFAKGMPFLMLLNIQWVMLVIEKDYLLTLFGKLTHYLCYRKEWGCLSIRSILPWSHDDESGIRSGCSLQWIALSNNVNRTNWSFSHGLLRLYCALESLWEGVEHLVSWASFLESEAGPLNLLLRKHPSSLLL